MQKFLKFQFIAAKGVCVEVVVCTVVWRWLYVQCTYVPLCRHAHTYTIHSFK